MFHPGLAPACPGQCTRHCWPQEGLYCSQGSADRRVESKCPHTGCGVPRGSFSLTWEEISTGAVKPHDLCRSPPWVSEAGLDQSLTRKSCGTLQSGCLAGSQCHLSERGAVPQSLEVCSIQTRAALDHDHGLWEKPRDLVWSLRSLQTGSSGHLQMLPLIPSPGGLTRPPCQVRKSAHL